MAGYTPYSQSPYDPRSARRPAIARPGRYERVSDPVVVPVRKSRSGVIWGTILGIGAGVLIVGLLRMGVTESSADLNPGPAATVNEPSFSVNPEYTTALSVLDASEAASESSMASAETDGAAKSNEASDGSVANGSDSTASDTGSTSATQMDERENVSGTDMGSTNAPMPASGLDSEPTTSGREGNSGRDLSIGLDEDPHRDTASPSGALPGVGTRSSLPGGEPTDNPY